ncbi:MAG TPA: class I SAM-dependent rRNA methyltransferase [Kofleriaceae bacterium]
MRARWRVTKPLRDAVAAGHPWVFDRAVQAQPCEPGDVITLVDERGPLATALADPTSPIRARILDRDPEAVCGGTWATERAYEAARWRARDPILAGCTGIRLVHGEADGCPGLVIDRYDSTIVVVFDGPAATAFWRARLADVLTGLERAGLVIDHVWLRGDRKLRGAGEAIRGNPPAKIVIAEDDARFAVDVRLGQKTGFFLDQRDNRRTIRRHANGLTALNVFCYTGGFSLHALLGGATRVTSVDLAAPAIAAIDDNLELSNLDKAKHEGVAMDAFAFFEQAQAEGRRWDLVIVDPPSFAPSEKARPQALNAYRRLVDAALLCTEPGGYFALASCSSHITEDDLMTIAARPFLRLRHQAGAASDHPVLPAFSEGRYLKFLLFDVG